MKPTLQYDIQKRIDTDLISRGFFGLLVYVVIFPAVFLPYQLYQQYPLTTWTITLGAVLVSALRLLHFKLTPFYYDRFPRFWVRIFACLALCHGAALSVLTCLVNTHEGFAVVYNLTMLVTAGVASASISSLSANVFLALAYTNTLILPSILVNLFSDSFQSFAFATAIYLIYLNAMAIRTNKEYMLTFEIEGKLEQQKRELEALSRTDALTKLVNRGYFNTLYGAIWNSCARNKVTITLLLMDLDYFKKVNDTYGHTSGDQCLKVVADILRECFRRETDICCRFGGEEFAVLMNGTPLHEAELLAEEVRAHIERASIENASHQFKITASLGLAFVQPSAAINPISLIERADEALYLAKKQGRNCVRSAAPQSASA